MRACAAVLVALVPCGKLLVLYGQVSVKACLPPLVCMKVDA